MEILRAGVQLVGIMWRKEHREIPLEAVLHLIDPISKGIVRPYMNGPVNLSVVVIAREKAALTSTVYTVMVLGVWRQVSTFTTCRFFPIILANIPPP